MRAFLALICAVQAADLLLTVAAVSRYGPSVEANPLVGAVLSLGVVGLVAWKSALLSVILAAAVLNPRQRGVLLTAGLLVGMVGAMSGLVALV